MIPRSKLTKPALDLPIGRPGCDPENRVEVTGEVDIVESLRKGINEVEGQDEYTNSTIVVGE